jgi:regulatory protein
LAANARTTALRLLSRRELSTAELRQRLIDRGFDTSEVEDVLSRLTGDGALDDRRAARAIARTHAAVKGRGRMRVERELVGRGIARDVAREVLDDVFEEISEGELLERAVRRQLRAGPITSQPQFRRLYQRLVRLGFSSDRVLQLLKKHSNVQTG